jgi:hypothetical protein
MEIVKSLNQVNLILKDEIMKKYQFRKLVKEKKMVIKNMRIKFDRKKPMEDEVIRKIEK